MPKQRTVNMPQVKAVARLVAAMVSGDKSMVELAEISGMGRNTVQFWCAAFHQAGATHVTAWREDPRGGCTIRLYKLGPGKDALASPTYKERRSERRAQSRPVVRPPPAAPPPPRAATRWQESSPYRR